VTDPRSDLAAARFATEEAQAAADTWGMNCGPGAAAAILGMTLDEIRPHLGDFEHKRYTNPTLMWSILRSVGATFIQNRPKTFPDYGLARIQWTGPWTKPGVPARVAYRHTHWVGVRTINAGSHVVSDEIEIFDINGISVGGWMPLAEWRDELVPWLLRECVPRADGGWFVTHSVEVTP
jgi:hypothetical protein